MGKYRSPSASAMPAVTTRGGVLHNRSRREALYVVAVIVVACFCIWRICQFGASVPQANTVMAVIQSTQVRTSTPPCAVAFSRATRPKVGSPAGVVG